jgi:hypothetical protein
MGIDHQSGFQVGSCCRPYNFLMDR